VPVQPLQTGISPRTADADALSPPPALAALVRAGVLDAELAALLWILLGARTPVVVAGETGSGRSSMAESLVACLPVSAVDLPVAADDGFAWLPEAGELGWSVEPVDRVDTRDPASPRITRADRATGVLLVRDLADASAGGPTGDHVRLLVRALSVGYGMIATMPGGGLDEVLDRLHAPELGVVDDERSRLGVVLVMAPPDGQRGYRVAAAHYLRPTAVDTHGHVQRLPPAVLATWNEARDRWDHFAWGLLLDLAGRAGMTPRELEADQARRAAAIRSAVTIRP
jgi:hypothetical protein